MPQITYEWLFAYLKRVGFEDSSPSRLERVFEHAEHDMLLAFSMQDDASENRPVRDADLTSVEFHLQQKGLLAGSLADLQVRVGKL